MDKKEAINVCKLLIDIIEINKANSAKNTFIKAMKDLSIERDNHFYLRGNFHFGTKSGRLSSSKPNMQNFPNNSEYGDLIKSCVVAPDGWLFAGCDFNSLEDRIGAILSKDENKIKEFTKGFDGHSLRAYFFFSDNIYPELKKYNPDDPKSINMIKKDYPDIREEAKKISFLLQYGGTAKGLERIGVPADQSVHIEQAYHNLYPGIKRFTDEIIKRAEQNGYVDLAFGLRLRTPILHSKKTYETSDSSTYLKEIRSCNNAVTQSWGMLINRACIATEKRIRASDFSNDILICNTIHDAVYYLVRDTPETIYWLNENLIPEMQWNDHPVIKHDIKMEAELDIGKSWNKMITIPNNSTLEEIKELRDKI